MGLEGHLWEVGHMRHDQEEVTLDRLQAKFRVGHELAHGGHVLGTHSRDGRPGALQQAGVPPCFRLSLLLRSRVGDLALAWADEKPP